MKPKPKVTSMKPLKAAKRWAQIDITTGTIEYVYSLAKNPKPSPFGPDWRVARVFVIEVPHA